MNPCESSHDYRVVETRDRYLPPKDTLHQYVLLVCGRCTEMVWKKAPTAPWRQP